MVPKIEDIVKVSKIHPSRVFNVYIFGSRVYNTYTKDSDWDIIMIANNSVESIEIKSNLYNIHIYTPDKFKKDLDWHKINNLECIFSPDWAKLKEDIKYDFSINIKKLRHSISHISSNSWVKAKRKIEFSEYKTGIKSLFHSIRIVMFGIQIASFNKITDFECANEIWVALNSEKCFSWDQLDNDFRKIRNKNKTYFRKITTK
jgi:predicted nucleotidyltransferase